MTSDCPNCRGSADLTAIWNFIGDRDENLTQGQPNLLNVGDIEGNVEIHGMVTPPHVDTDQEFDTPRSVASHASVRSSVATLVSVYNAEPARAPGARYNAYPAFTDDNNESASWSGMQLTTRAKPKPKAKASAKAKGSAQSDSAAGASRTFHSQTELHDGRHALLVDPGSVGNLAGAPWIRQAATLGKKHGRLPKQTKRKKPLSVSGVGTGAQLCEYDCCVPISLKSLDNRHISGTFTTPTLGEQALPALLGLNTLIEMRCILDFRTLQMHMCGPDDKRLELPSGTDTFQMYQAPAGHLMLPCCEYPSWKPKANGTEPSISLISDTQDVQSDSAANVSSNN